MSPDCFWFDTRGELGSGLGDGKIKEPQFSKSVCMDIKGFYLTMKHGEKQNVLTLSNVKMLVTGTVLPKEEHLQNPQTKSKYEFVFFEECKM